MKEKDFDNIGKRLYDLEADPPANGWKKIGSALANPAGSGKVVWLRKHWWKPLIILIPVGLYIGYTSNDSSNLSSSQLSLNSSVEKLGEDNRGETTESITRNMQGKETLVENSEENRVNKSPVTPEGSTISSDRNSKALVSGHPSLKKSTIVGGDAADKRESRSNNVGLHSQLEPMGNSTANDNAVEDFKSGVSIVGESSTHAKMEGNEHGSIEQNSMQGLDETKNGDTEISGISNTDEPENKGFEGRDKPQGQVSNTYAATDSAKKIEVPDSAFIIASAKDSTSAIKEENEPGKSHQWRITLSLLPQYVKKTVQPVTGDEVLLTKVNRSGNSYKAGFGFSAGAGLAMTKNLYLDAQLSYSQASQRINFAYATGKVDTLVAVQQSDETVRITPVYATSDREISSRYEYAGIKLGITQYFWSTARRRFNVSATAGAHYLVSAEVNEKVNGRWISLDHGALNKLNYTVMFSGGYNLNLNKGWELMINPALTYYVRKVSSRALPYSIQQQSFGLNVMLSKALGTL